MTVDNRLSLHRLEPPPKIGGARDASRDLLDAPRGGREVQHCIDTEGFARGLTELRTSKHGAIIGEADEAANSFVSRDDGTDQLVRPK
jgi:hypothetical protein